MEGLSGEVPEEGGNEIEFGGGKGPTQSDQAPAKVTTCLHVTFLWGNEGMVKRGGKGRW